MYRLGVTFIILFSLLVLNVVSGCTGDRTEIRGNTLPAGSITEARALALQSRVECVASNECHPAVAMLAIAEETGVTVCTGFLIASDVMMTNSHCIPKDMRSAGATCANRLWGFFPTFDGLPSAQAECATVIEASAATKDLEPDYALIQLARPIDRQTLIPSSAGMPEDQSAVVFPVTPDKSSGIWHGSLGRKNCRPVLETVLAPFFNNPKSPIATISGCQLHPGNSGSPIVGSNGKVWSVAFADLSEKSPLLAPLAALKTSSANAPINLATNLACVSSLLAEQRAPSCEVKFAQYENLERNWTLLKDSALQKDLNPFVEAAINASTRLDLAIELVGQSGGLTWARTSPKCPDVHSDTADCSAPSSALGLWKLSPGLTPYFQFGFSAEKQP